MPAQQVPPRRECQRARSQARIDDAASLPAWAQTLQEVAQALFRQLVVELTERTKVRGCNGAQVLHAREGKITPPTTGGLRGLSLRCERP